MYIEHNDNDDDSCGILSFQNSGETSIMIDHALQHNTSLQNADRGISDLLSSGSSILKSLRDQRVTLKVCSQQVFKKPQLQSVSISFKFVHLCFYLYLLSHLYVLLLFWVQQLFFMFHPIWSQFFDKFCYTTPSDSNRVQCLDLVKLPGCIVYYWIASSLESVEEMITIDTMSWFCSIVP